MPKLVKNGELSQNNWQFADAEADASQLQDGQWVLTLNQFLSLNGSFDGASTGVLLKSDEDITQLAPYINQLQLICVDFAAFADGRSFSQARSLRDHYDYSGELRATGAFIQDQLFYLSRCGVDAFLLGDEADIESVKGSLKDFSESYQAACDEPQPLFRRRV